MKREEYIDSLSAKAHESSEAASSVCRTTGLAGGIACWAFKDQQFVFPRIILASLTFLCIFFLLDILQYVLGSEASRKLFFLAVDEPLLSENTLLKIRRRLNKRIHLLFLLKICSLILMYFLIGLEVLRRMG
jgi:hypothetical protein